MSEPAAVYYAEYTYTAPTIVQPHNCPATLANGGYAALLADHCELAGRTTALADRVAALAAQQIEQAARIARLERANSLLEIAVHVLQRKLLGQAPSPVIDIMLSQLAGEES